MGARSSKSSNTKKGTSHSNTNVNAYGTRATGVQPNELKKSNLEGDLTPLRISTDTSTLEIKQTKQEVATPKTGVSGFSSKDDVFYDGIPRLPATLSEKSKSRSFRVGDYFTLATLDVT